MKWIREFTRLEEKTPENSLPLRNYVKKIYVCEYKNNVVNVASFSVTAFSLVQLYRGH